uniref:X-ray repair cross-complementing protein 6 n=1 Tax=Pan troglodytes TaxID=9598 RepID=A0A2I3TAT2_PANTR
MSGWELYYKIESDEENLEASGDYKYSGRHSLIFLVDASRAMFESQSEVLTPFDMSIQCIQSVYISKIISNLLAVVFYGTEKDKNSVNFKNIYVLQELDNPSAKQILELDQFKGQQGQKRFQDLMGHGSDYLLSEVLWVCASLFSDVRLKMSHTRIMLLTSEENPHGNDSAKASRARTEAGDLQDTGIFLDLMHLKKPGGFDLSLFYRDTINIAEDEDLRVHFEESSKLEDLLPKVHAKDTRKQALSRLKLKLNKDIVISVGICNLVQKALKPPPVKLYQETNEPVKTKTLTRTFNTNTCSLLLPSDTKRSQIFGSHQIILEKEETEELKWFNDPGLMLMGFKPLVMLKKHHYLRPSLLVYPEELLVIGSSILFSALLIKCLEKEVIALCRYTPHRNIPPYFVALKIQVTPPGFQLVFLPFADDKMKVPFMYVMATPEQMDKMKAIIQKLRFTYRSDSFENPVLQQNLEALALDLMEPEQAVDLTLPKVEAMNKRLGSLVDEFKELVYPPDYNPEGKVTKRKHDNEGSGSKRPKKLKTHISKGMLGKFTVPMLKEACRVDGLKSVLKKQDLLKALTTHFQD